MTSQNIFVQLYYLDSERHAGHKLGSSLQIPYKILKSHIPCNVLTNPQIYFEQVSSLHKLTEFSNIAPIKHGTVNAALSSVLFIFACTQANFELDAGIRASERWDFSLPRKFILSTVSLDKSFDNAVTGAVQI